MIWWWWNSCLKWSRRRNRPRFLLGLLEAVVVFWTFSLIWAIYYLVFQNSTIYKMRKDRFQKRERISIRNFGGAIFVRRQYNILDRQIRELTVIVDFRVRSGINVLGVRLGRSRWCLLLLLLFSWDGNVVSHAKFFCLDYADLNTTYLSTTLLSYCLPYWSVTITWRCAGAKW